MLDIPRSNHYDVGALVHVASAFTDLDGLPADPTDVTLVYQPAMARKVSVTLLDLSHEGTGIFAYDLDTTGRPGVWRYRFVGTGDVQAAGDLEFVVDDSPLIR